MLFRLCRIPPTKGRDAASDLSRDHQASGKFVRTVDTIDISLRFSIVPASSTWNGIVPADVGQRQVEGQVCNHFHGCCIPSFNEPVSPYWPASVQPLPHRFRMAGGFTHKENCMRHYEIVFIVHPDQSEQVPAMIERYRSIVTARNGQSSSPGRLGAPPAHLSDSKGS